MVDSNYKLSTEQVLEVVRENSYKALDSLLSLIKKYNLTEQQATRELYHVIPSRGQIQACAGWCGRMRKKVALEISNYYRIPLEDAKRIVYLHGDVVDWKDIIKLFSFSRRNHIGINLRKICKNS